MNATATKDVMIQCRAKAFTGRGVEPIRCMVSGNTVRVWDEIAGFLLLLTLCEARSSLLGLWVVVAVGAWVRGRSVRLGSSVSAWSGSGFLFYGGSEVAP